MTDRIFENPHNPWNPEELPHVARRHMDETGADPVRLVRLSDPVYYTDTENPHTDDEGRLPHDGGPLPEFLAGKKVEMITTDSDVPVIANYGGLKLGDRPPGDHVTAYRIVETLPTPGISGRMRSAQKAMYGSEGREAGDPIPSSSRSRLDFYTDEEVKHRNELAAHLGVPVPGMSEWLREPLREARRLRYREAALTGYIAHLGAQGIHACKYNSECGSEAIAIADAMLDQEQEDQ